MHNRLQNTITNNDNLNSDKTPQQQSLKKKVMHKVIVVKASDKMKMLLKDMVTFADEPEQPTNLLQKFDPNMLYPALSHKTIKLLETLNSAIENKSKKYRNNKAHLQIYGSFVLYYAMLMMGKNPKWTPRDLDLIVEIPDMIIARHGVLTELLKEYQFEITDKNERYHYIKLDRPSDSANKEPGTFDMSITLAFRGYKSFNPIHLTRHRIQFDSQNNGSISFDGDNQILKKELFDDLELNIAKADINEMATPSLNMVNVFSRLLKFNDDFKTLFIIDSESTFKAISNIPWITTYFYNRLETKNLKFFSENEISSHKNNCYLEMADLISRNYFTRTDTQPIIIGFLSALIKIYYEENNLEPLSENEMVALVKPIVNQLQQEFSRESYQAQSKKKHALVADFYEAVMTALDNMLTIKNPLKTGIFSAPGSVQKYKPKVKMQKIQTENKAIIDPISDHELTAQRWNEYAHRYNQQIVAAMHWNQYAFWYNNRIAMLQQTQSNSLDAPQKRNGNTMLNLWNNQQRSNHNKSLLESRNTNKPN